MQKIQKSYKTSDLYLSAFLKARGMRLKDKQREGKRFIFIFEDQDNRDALIQEFFNDGVIGITSFKNALQDLKTMVFNV